MIELSLYDWKSGEDCVGVTLQQQYNQIGIPSLVKKALF